MLNKKPERLKGKKKRLFDEYLCKDFEFVFTDKDINSAVEWLKNQIENEVDNGLGECRTDSILITIHEAFEDVMT